MSEETQYRCVISLKEKRKLKQYGCNCTTTELCNETELIECSVCGRFYTCFQYIKHMLQRGWWLKRDIPVLKEEVNKLMSEKHKLKNEVNYLRSAAKKLKKDSHE